ncbi:MAG: restriction endonuclease subunit S [Candidatus Ratteibacteria bacterium]
MKKGWEIKKLGDVCEIINGGTPKTGTQHYWNGDFLWITPAEMGKRKNPFIDSTLRKLTEAGLKNSSAKLLPPFSIILSTRAPIGYIVINLKPMATNQGCRGLIPSSKLQFKYLYYFLYGNVPLLNALGTGTTFKELSSLKLKKVLIPLPPLPEQKQIVKILDEVFEALNHAKENTEKNLQNACELFESYLNNIFTNPGPDWEEKKLGDVCEIFAGQSPKGIYYNDRGEGLPFYQGKKDFTDKYIDEPRIWTTSITREAFKGDILMSVRAPVGPVNFSTQRICIGRGLAAIRPKEQLDKEFLFNFLLKYEKEIIGNVGAVFNSISKRQIENIPIPLPPLPEQKQIVVKLDSLAAETKKLEVAYKQKLLDIEELKKSILQKAFNGELTG